VERGVERLLVKESRYREGSEAEVDDQQTRRIPPPVLPTIRSGRVVSVFPYAVSKSRLERVVTDLRLPVHVVKEMEGADLILTLKGQYRKMPKKLREAERHNVPIYVIRSNTMAQMDSFLRELVDSPELNPLVEAEEAVRRVQDTARPVELTPQTAPVRRLQHELAERYNMYSRSTGNEPNRRVTIFPNGGKH
jgi:hypothetical protein